MPEPDAHLQSRRARARRHVDVSRGRGLEVGPLYAPLVTRGEADVRYVDVHLTPELRDHYATHPGIPVDDIVDVDFALIHDGEERSLAQAVAEAAPYDWVVASHVVEHVPDVVGWLADVAEVLADGGRLVLAVPDRRYCFDALRPPTTVGQMLRAHLDGDTRPSSRAVFDHFATAVGTTAADLWRGARPGPDAVIHGTAYAWDQVRRSQAEGTYVDCHVWLFTPASFVAQLRTLAELDLLDLTLADITPTAADELEFWVSLERVPRALGGEARRAAVTAGYPAGAAADALDARPADAPPLPAAAAAAAIGAGDGDGDLALSARERRAVLAKRALLGRARSALARVRRA